MRTCWVFLMVIISMISTRMIHAAPPATQPVAQSGVDDGLRLAITAAKTTFAKGEAIDLRIAFTNTQTKPIPLYDPRQASQWVLSCRSADGKSYLAVNGSEAGMTPSEMEIRPGVAPDEILQKSVGRWEQAFGNQSEVLTVLPAGKYTLWATFVPLPPPVQGPTPFWAAHVSSGPVKFEVSDTPAATQPTTPPSKLATARPAENTSPVVLQVERTGKEATAESFVRGVRQALGSYARIVRVIKNEGPDKELAIGKDVLIYHKDEKPLPVGKFVVNLRLKLNELGPCDYWLESIAAGAPATQAAFADDKPQVLTGTITKDAAAKIATFIGQHGVLFICSEARLNELSKRAPDLTPDQLPKNEFTKQAIIVVYALGSSSNNSLSLDKSNLTISPPELGFLFSWYNGDVAGLERPSIKFIFAIIPITPAVKITLTSQPTHVDRHRIVTELSAILGGDIVDGLQAAIAPKSAAIKSGEDILIDFALHLADPGAAKPEQFGNTAKGIFVWDGKYSNGYRSRLGVYCVVIIFQLPVDWWESRRGI